LPWSLKGKEYDEAIQSAVITNTRVMRQMPRLLQEASLEIMTSFSYILAEMGTADFWVPALELSGCETLSEIITCLKFEQELAQIGGWSRFADQSSLSRMLDKLTQKQIDEIQLAGREIWWQRSQIRNRDWRKYLWLDFDLSGLPCSAHAEESQKGYFGGKKHHWTSIGPCECR
jgi:hypothetical protein